MFEYLGTVLVSVDPGFDVLRYLTVRTIGGTVTALLLSILMGPLIINSLKSMQFEQFVRKDGPQSHYKKTGTPTMLTHTIKCWRRISIVCFCSKAKAYRVLEENNSWMF